MLGDNTNCDLSAYLAKLDITALEKQVTGRFFSLSRQISDITSELSTLDKITDTINDKLLTVTSTKHKTLKNLVNDLTITAELARTLRLSANKKIQCVNLIEENK